MPRSATTRRSIGDAASSPSRLVDCLVDALDGCTELADALHHAFDSRGVHDRERFIATILGVMRVADDAGCEPRQTREVVRGFVGATLGERARAVGGAVALAVEIVDAVYARYGADGPTTDARHVVPHPALRPPTSA